jgi:rod shape determining protein RodA
MATLSPSLGSSPESPVLSLRRGGFDWVLALLVIVLALWGVATVFSATRGEPGYAGESNKQLVFIGVGLLIMGGMALSRYRALLHVQAAIYFANLALLTLLLILPHSMSPVIKGARSWIRLGPVSLQPSEFSKFAVLVCLSAFWARRQKEAGSFKTLLLSLLYLAPVVLLVMKQPDFGTTMATISIWLGVAFFAGARWTHLLATIGIGIALFMGAWHGGILQEHQKQRLSVFLNPSTDKKKSGYQLNQAQIAIGGGQITGQGFGRGLQNNAHYVPENHTDFVFTVVAEEWGFFGGALLIGLFLLLLSRTLKIAGEGDSYFGSILCGGFSALLAFHCLINIGMTMRLMPVTGVPLPFFSYGGSSFLSFSLGIGACLSVSARRR